MWTGRFGKFWFGNYERRVFPTVQVSGRMGIKRPEGRELEYGPPTSGNVYVADADVADKLERLVDASNNVIGWRVTTSSGDQTELYDSTGGGRLLSITDRNGLTQKLSYGDGAGGILYSTTPNAAGYQAPTCTPPAGFAYWSVAGVPMPPDLLLCVTDPWGRQVNFGYDSQGQVASMADLSGGIYLFGYDGPSAVRWGASDPAPNVLTSVTFPDGKTRTYYYNEPSYINGGAACANLPATGLPAYLTGIVDENGNRFAIYQYDCNGRPISTEHAGGVEHITLAYTNDANGGIAATTVTDPLGTARGYSFSSIVGVNRNTSLSQPTSSSDAAAETYDANGNVASRTDFNGNLTNYAYDLTRNLETNRTEALTAAGASTPQTRTISTQWHATWRLPVKVAEPLKITSYVYNGDGGVTCGMKADGVTPVPGVLCSKSIQATSDTNGSQGFGATPVGTARTWSYTYNANGKVLTADGPRTDVADVTTYTYYADNDADLGKRGNVATITNALGQTTSITAYNANGQPTTIVDPNGLTTTLTYDARQRLTSRNVGGEITTYTYDGVGQLTNVTLPDGSALAYTYDPAHRLTQIQDSLGNKIVYTLDAMGNRTQKQVLDPTNALMQTRSRVYNALNRLYQDIGAANQTTTYAYDNQGNVTSVTDPLTRVTSNQYDALNRLVTVTDPANGQTHYGYDGLSQLASVTDPRNLTTSYNLDGLGNLNTQSSPDTGTTQNTYDVAGNVLTRTDAKGQITSYTYDALNRVTLVTFNDGSKQAYAYDQGVNGIGRLTSITETDPASNVTSLTQYSYDQKGRVTSDTRTVSGQVFATGYSYDSAGRLASLTYPSGRSVTYSYDADGRVSQISTTKGGTTQIVVQNVQYQPFGTVKSYTLGNGQIVARTIDQDGRIAGYTLGNTSYSLTFDAASRITGITDTGNPANANAYGYDALDRLASAMLPNLNYGYGYDAVGNRLSKTTGVSTDSYTYSPTSNQIASLAPASGPARSFAFDANGSTTGDGVNQYGYDARGRMTSATTAQGSTSYQVNALGQRIRKSGPSGTALYQYDHQGHLIGETDGAGNLIRELIYLSDLPVAVVQ